MTRVNDVMTASFAVALSFSAVFATLYITFRYPFVQVFAPASEAVMTE